MCDHDGLIRRTRPTPVIVVWLAVVSAALLLASCGDGDIEGVAPTQPGEEPESTSSSTTPTVPVPTATSGSLLMDFACPSEPDPTSVYAWPCVLEGGETTNCIS
jgi:hypothetical protein